jgi:hypothetical protein
MLASLMVLQTELPPLEFDILRGKKKQEYFFYFFIFSSEGVWGSSFTTWMMRSPVASLFLGCVKSHIRKAQANPAFEAVS